MHDRHKVTVLSHSLEFYFLERLKYFSARRVGHLCGLTSTVSRSLVARRLDGGAFGFEDD